MTKSDYKVIGVMSGTSLDGIDIIYATYTYNKFWEFEIEYAETIAYPKTWHSILSKLVKTSINNLQTIDNAYTEYLAQTILDFINRNHLEAIDFIASHGHTALHQPENTLTYQIGNQQLLAEKLNRKIVCDFRVQDVKLGGQGAPLVPIGDQLLFKDYDYCLNLGGFANISYERNNERIAFDICPVNIVLNYYVSNLGLAYDDNGHLASTGNVQYDLLVQLNELDFYKEQPPKSLGLEWVQFNCFAIIDARQIEIKDILRTYVEHIAIQISKILSHTNSRVLVTGGGVYNKFLMQRIRTLSNAIISIPDNEIVEYKEALIFGLLGILKDRGEVNCLKSVTGATRNHSSGKIMYPEMQN
ncbi:anhydro-N-acetylmuramic acid kinase [Winogradskyella bathintestinalis]|uniref:Anhydro-N-acetylmuramic acid kinase n=1 Tax=Winogradskyella bathintestinalis TaxID=3035208 RepID=A0ABT7ZY15_9FLAO|nr:anhydro-N-acetylmuramic acid kinase [Winogradskyella bathintestinalis]MDN3493908.1 anhydro-N-acetylmuramic acid kinase [Winogradskyella bathintestinalis]